MPSSQKHNHDTTESYGVCKRLCNPTWGLRSIPCYSNPDSCHVHISGASEISWGCFGHAGHFYMDPFLAANDQFAIRLDSPINAPITLVLHFSFTMYQKDVGYHLTAYTAADGTQMLLGATHMQACTPEPQPQLPQREMHQHHMGTAWQLAVQLMHALCAVMLVSNICNHRDVGQCLTSTSSANILAAAGWQHTCSRQGFSCAGGSYWAVAHCGWSASQPSHSVVPGRTH